jgi:hypothetical protein
MTFFNLRFTLLAVFISILLPLSVSAQGDQVSLRFITFPKVSKPEKFLLVTGKGKTEEIEVASNAISKPVQVFRQSTWMIVERESDENGEVKLKPLGSVKALDSNRQLVFLIRKGADHSDGYKLIAFDDRRSMFGKGKMLFLNAARVQIGGVVGKEKFALNPNSYKIIKPKPDKDGRLCHTQLFYMKDKKPKMFYSSVWPLNTKGRVITFFYHDARNKRLRLHTIRDTVKST